MVIGLSVVLRCEAMAKTNRERAESFLCGVSNDESWIDASSEYAKRRLTELLDEVAKEAKTEALSNVRHDWGVLDIEAGVLDD